MADPFDELFNKQSRPVRRHIQVRLTVDDDGNPVLETVEGEAIDLSSDGSIDTTRIVPDRFYHCGCNASHPMGGRCAVSGCVHISCARCFGRCALCMLPICLEHSRSVVPKENQHVRLCPKCFDDYRRQHRVRRVIRGLLRPFIVFDDKGGG